VWFREWPGNSEPRSDRIAKEGGQGKPGYLEVSDSEAAALTVPETVLIRDLVLFTCPEDGGDMFLRNVGSNQSHAVLHLRRRYFSWSSP
jgi:hypothetical protein